MTDRSNSLSSLLFGLPLSHPSPKTVTLSGDDLTLDSVISLSHPSSKVQIHPPSLERLKKSRAVITDILSNSTAVYGINTGFGRLSTVKIADAELSQLQINLIRSHSSGVGEVVERGVVRRMMALRINTLLKGCSGVSLETFHHLVDFFNSGLTPLIRTQGSVGACGDLVPLAMMALVVCGEGEVFEPGDYLNSKPVTADLLANYKLTAAKLLPKDGLSLINGTQFICAYGSVAMENAVNAIRLAHLAAAMSIAVLRGHLDAYDDQISSVRPHPGQALSAACIRRLLPKSSYGAASSHDLQSSYSLRCLPQVHGCVLEAIQTILTTFHIEINSAVDNPLIFYQDIKGDEKVKRCLSGGNFHGEYPAKAFDTLAIYTHELASISYARLMRLFNPDKNFSTLPAFLVPKAGLCSGFMTWENTSASLVSENKVLTHPSSTDSISTCADKEDHVSMGAFSARKAVTVTENVLKSLAIEIMGATQGWYLMRDSTKFPPVMDALFGKVSSVFPKMESDKNLMPSYEKILEMCKNGELHDIFLRNSVELSP